MRMLGFALLGLTLILAPVASALPTPGFFGEEAREVTGRMFPEAMQTNDYLGIEEAVELLPQLAQENPELVTFHTIGESVGWENAAGGHDTFPVFAVTLTNKESTVPLDKRVNLLFMLSIHGNEKGGREGGVRVIEDFINAHNGMDDTGIATDERVGMLDYMQLIFLFPNPDGWAHELAEYRHNDAEYLSLAGVETQNFVRVNGNGVDLNRQTPTQGWSRAEGSHAALSQPESRAYVPWLANNFSKIHFASDLHGMLWPANAFVNSSKPIHCAGVDSPAGVPLGPAEGEQVCMREGNFVLTMVPAGQFNPREEVLITGLAELLKERMNADDYFAEWRNLPEAGVWGGEYNDWGTVWDTIGYVDSGFSSDWFAQDTGLDAPGVDFEFSYNHITFDNYYPGLGQRINAYHVETTRVIVATFMDIAALQTQVSIETDGKATAWVPTRHVATSADNGELTRWAAENPADDQWDWAHGGAYNATLNDWFRDREGYLVDGELPGVLDEVQPEELTGDLSGYDNLVIPGSAVEPLLADREQARQAVENIRAFVEDGGKLVLTDSALQLLTSMGLVDDDALSQSQAYAGYTNWVNQDHELYKSVRGLARQLFEPMPLGYQEGVTSPVWSVSKSSFEDAGGTTVGVLGPERANVGTLTLGEGEIVIIGALLPDPTEEYYHPYGLASYATTYTGNQLMRQSLGWELTFQQPPRVTEGGVVLPDDEPTQNQGPDRADPNADSGSEDIPFPSLAPLLALGAALAFVQRRMRRE